MAKTRLDTLLVERGLFESRSRAAAAVMAGEVRLGEGGARAQKPGQMVAPDAPVSVDDLPGFVSRGGVKLANTAAAARERDSNSPRSTSSVSSLVFAIGGGYT